MRRLFPKIFSLLAFSLLFTLISNFAVKAQTNILFADDFENWIIKQTAWGTAEVPTNWEPWAIFSSAVSSPTISQFIAKSTDSYSGNFAYQLGSNYTVGGYTRTTDAIALPPGATLELNFFARGSHTDEPFRARVYLNIFDDQGNFVGQIFIAIPNFLESYTQLTGRLTLPCNAHSGRLHIDKADWGTINVDDLELSVLAATPCPIKIDIKPGSFPNSINLRSKGIIPVAILSTNTFDAPLVLDPLTFTLEDAPGIKHAVEDVNGDGLNDLVLFFKTQDAGIGCGQTTAVLSGQRFDDGVVTGVDTIKIVGC